MIEEQADRTDKNRAPGPPPSASRAGTPKPAGRCAIGQVVGGDLDDVPDAEDQPGQATGQAGVVRAPGSSGSTDSGDQQLEESNVIGDELVALRLGTARPGSTADGAAVASMITSCR
ncbi:MAG: hypothetical protein J2P23_05600 [Microlunatus sp.]|nr:hypothetical protein [Microlunatus sp.]